VSEVITTFLSEENILAGHLRVPVGVSTAKHMSVLDEKSVTSFFLWQKGQLEVAAVDHAHLPQIEEFLELLFAQTLKSVLIKLCLVGSIIPGTVLTNIGSCWLFLPPIIS
jgi:hypothetical protein